MDFFLSSETQIDLQDIDSTLERAIFSLPSNYTQGIPNNPSHLARFPDLMPVTTNVCYDFDVVVPPDGSNWVFNQQKLFIKMNSTITVTVSYLPQVQGEQLYLRAMIIYSSPQEMNQPVKRCANHRMGNSDDAQSLNVIKCKNTQASYMGKGDGEVFQDRLSVLIPIDNNVFDENGKISENILFEFACQNSCSSGMNRRATSIVFTLEDQTYQLLGKRAIQFKVCSCPKRDAEREAKESKRKSSGNDAFPRGKRPKLQMPTQTPTHIKTEPESPHSPNEDSQMSSNEIFETTTISLTMPRVLAPIILKLAHDAIAGKMADDRTVPEEQYKKLLKEYQTLRKRLE